MKIREQYLRTRMNLQNRMLDPNAKINIDFRLNKIVRRHFQDFSFCLNRNFYFIHTFINNYFIQINLAAHNKN
jgi:hypothetical protein